MGNINLSANQLAADNAALDDDNDLVPIIVPGVTGTDKGRAHTITELKKRVGGGGVGSLTFFSRTATLSLSGSYANAMSGNYTPAATDEIVGLLLSAGLDRSSTTANAVRMKLRRGTSDITAELYGPSTVGYHRQLFLDKPGSTSQQTYALQARRTGSSAKNVYAGSSLTAFRMPDGVVADLLTASENVSQNGDFLSVTITPSSAAAKIKLNLLVLSTATTNMAIELRRGTTSLVTTDTSIPAETRATGIAFPTNFEDWVDSPNTTNPVTYHARKSDSGTDTVIAGTYLMAQEVA